MCAGWVPPPSTSPMSPPAAIDGFWEYGLHPWDVAAAWLLVREAGGYISEPEGEGHPVGSGDVLAANDHLHGLLRTTLRQA